MPVKSRLSRLLTAFAVTAIVVASFHVYEYRINSRQPNYSPLGYRAWTGQSWDWPPNYSRIDDGLWMGGFVSTPPDGTQAVLNVCESKDPYRVEAQQWNPIRDGPPAPSLDWLARQVEFIESQRAIGHAVYVHCQAGLSRAGMVMTAYLMKRQGWSRDRAIRFLQEKRPGVSPNPAFMPLLAEWEKTLRHGQPPGNTTQP